MGILYFPDDNDFSYRGACSKDAKDDLIRTVIVVVSDSNILKSLTISDWISAGLAASDFYGEDFSNKESSRLVSLKRGS